MSQIPVLRAHQMQQLSRLTHAQKKAIAAFLKFMAYESEDLADSRVAREALESYWKPFDG